MIMGNLSAHEVAEFGPDGAYKIVRFAPFSNLVVVLPWVRFGVMPAEVYSMDGLYTGAAAAAAKAGLNVNDPICALRTSQGRCIICPASDALLAALRGA